MVGIGLMRGIVFAAIKLNSIWKKFWGVVQNFGANFFQTLPILPLPGGEKVWLGTFGKVMYWLPTQKAEIWNRQWTERVERWVNPKETNALNQRQINEVINRITTKWETAPVAIAAVANVTAGEEWKVAAASIPAIYTAVAGLEKAWKPAAEVEKVVGAFADISGIGKNRREKYDVDKAIEGKNKVEDVNTTLFAIDLNDNKNAGLKKSLETMKNAGFKKSFNDASGNPVEYTLTETNGIFAFTKLNTAWI